MQIFTSACKHDTCIICSCTTLTLAAQPHRRVGTYTGHSGRIIQLLSLGDVLLSLGDDRKLFVWAADTYDAPKVDVAHNASQCAAACVYLFNV